MNMKTHRILLGVLSFSFLVGIVLGALLSVRGGAETEREIFSFLSPLGEGAVFHRQPALSLFTAFLYPVVCFLLGLSLPGVALIPLVFSGRALIFTFTVGSCIRVFGATQGLLTAVGALALPLLLSLPPLFIIGTGGMGTSLRLLASVLGRDGTLSGQDLSKRSFLQAAVCLLPLLLSAGAELYICPLLLKLTLSA